MKKSELTQLTQLIELLVEREVKKQLSKLIGEVFQNMAGKAMVTERVVHTTGTENVDAIAKEIEEAKVKSDPHEFRASLKELFQGSTPVTRMELEEGVAPAPQMRQLAKDPVLNQILNQTVPLRTYEKAKGMGMYAAMDQPAMAMMPQAPAVSMMGVGEMMSESEMPSFARGIPTMPNVPVSAPSTSEGHAVMAALPEGLSALDVAKAVTPPAVASAMTDFSRMRKVLEMSKGKRY